MYSLFDSQVKQPYFISKPQIYTSRDSILFNEPFGGQGIQNLLEDLKTNS
jgi:hypothetical protein